MSDLIKKLKRQVKDPARIYADSTPRDLLRQAVDRLNLLEAVLAAALELRDKSRWYQPCGENVCVPDRLALIALFKAVDAADQSSAVGEPSSTGTSSPGDESGGGDE